MTAHSSTYYDLLEALPHSGCAVCRLVDRYAREHIDAFFYEQVTNVARRAEIRAARGYCSLHAAMLPAPARMLGIAIVHHDVFTNVLRDLDSVGAARKLLASGSRVDAIRPRSECPLCAYERDREQHVLHTLLQHSKDARLRAAIEASDGICLPHFAASFDVPEVSRDHREGFVRFQVSKMAGLRDQLEKFIDHANASNTLIEPAGAEVDAPLRALKMASGRIVRQDGRRR